MKKAQQKIKRGIKSSYSENNHVENIVVLVKTWENVYFLKTLEKMCIFLKLLKNTHFDNNTDLFVTIAPQFIPVHSTVKFWSLVFGDLQYKNI